MSKNESTATQTEKQHSVEQSNWQPIETAPKDGTVVLLYWPYWRDRAVLGYFIDYWQSNVAISSGPEPTHWMPLPAAPTTQQAVEQTEKQIRPRYFDLPESEWTETERAREFEIREDFGPNGDGTTAGFFQAQQAVGQPTKQSQSAQRCVHPCGLSYINHGRQDHPFTPESESAVLDALVGEVSGKLGRDLAERDSRTLSACEASPILDPRIERGVERYRHAELVSPINDSFGHSDGPTQAASGRPIRTRLTASFDSEMLAGMNRDLSHIERLVKLAGGADMVISSEAVSNLVAEIRQYRSTAAESAYEIETEQEQAAEDAKQTTHCRFTYTQVTLCGHSQQGHNDNALGHPFIAEMRQDGEGAKAKLLPCPFCKHPLHIEPSVNGKWFYPQCTNDACVFADNDTRYPTREEAVNAANRRAQPLIATNLIAAIQRAATVLGITSEDEQWNNPNALLDLLVHNIELGYAAKAQLPIASPLASVLSRIDHEIKDNFLSLEFDPDRAEEDWKEAHRILDMVAEIIEDSIEQPPIAAKNPKPESHPCPYIEADGKHRLGCAACGAEFVPPIAVDPAVHGGAYAETLIGTCAVGYLDCSLVEFARGLKYFIEEEAQKPNGDTHLINTLRRAACVGWELARRGPESINRAVDPASLSAEKCAEVLNMARHQKHINWGIAGDWLDARQIGSARAGGPGMYYCLLDAQIIAAWYLLRGKVNGK